MTALTERRPNVVIRASAGTGKTYQLSNRYLQLAIDGQPPEQVLASTFARKAAGEILGRVLVRLAAAVLDDAARVELAAAVERDLSAADCQRLLKKLLGELHRLRIGTLDSFFVQLAGNFTLELGLPTGWQIVDELDDKQLRLEAIRQVLAGGSSAELSALVHLLFKGEAIRSVTQQIAEIVEQLYGVFCDSAHDAWHALPRPPVLRPEEVERAIEQLAAVPQPADSRFAKAWRDDVARAGAQDWEDFISTGLPKALAGEGTYYRKPIDDTLRALYEPLLRHARGFLVGQLVGRTEATFKLLAAYGENYQRLKIARRGLRFDDVPRLLSAGLADGLMQHTHWRLDTSIGHLLLDEFQDTSLPQWNVLKPFAQACCAAGSGRSFFCVGDVKQAIYRWRGGVSQLFDAAQSELTGVSEASLTKSYRSSQVVIDTVNQVFANLSANQALTDCAEVAKQWQEWFTPHTTAKTDLAGYVALCAAPRADEGQKQSRVTLEFAARRIAELAAQCPGKSIGVLVRRNRAVAELIYLLRSKHQLQASQEGGNPLTDSAAVQLVLSLVKLADHPGDLPARFHVAASPLAGSVGLADHADHAAAVALAARLRRQFLDEGYGRTVYGWLGPLSVRCGQRDLDRLIQLVELAYAFDRRATARTSDFVAFVEQTKVEDPSASNIRVMTVHQAKGLEFDLVVLPELEGRLKGAPPQLAVGRGTPIEPIERVCRHVGKAFWPLLPPEYQRLFEVWPREAVNESLCLLYVALTRAVHALHLIVPPTSENEKTFPQTFTGVLRSALVAGRKMQPGCIGYDHGQPDWFRQSAPDEASALRSIAAHEPEAISVRLCESELVPRELPRRSPSSLEGAGKVRIERLLNGDGDAFFARGTLWHAWLEQIEWLGEGPAGGEPGDEQLRTLALALGHGLNLDEEIAEFRRVLRQPELRGVLSRSAYADPRQLGLAATQCDLRVLRERRFAVRDADGLLSGTIDRLVLFERNAHVQAADLIDFKTDRLTGPDDLERRVEFYRPQIAAYRRAVAKIHSLEPGQIASRLVFVQSGVVCAVG